MCPGYEARRVRVFINPSSLTFEKKFSSGSWLESLAGLDLDFFRGAVGKHSHYFELNGCNAISPAEEGAHPTPCDSTVSSFPHACLLLPMEQVRTTQNS